MKCFQRSPLFIFGLFFLAVILAIPTAKVYLKSRKAVEKNQEIQAQLEELEKRKSELGKEVTQLETEGGREEKIREKFDVIKPGENVLKIINKSPENDRINQEEENKNFFSKIWRWMKDIF